MKKIWCLILTLLSLNTLAQTTFHLSVIPTKANKTVLLGQIEQNLQACIARHKHYDCKKVRITSNQLESYRNLITGTVFGVITDCRRNFEADIITGHYDKDAESKGRFFNLHLDFISENNLYNTSRCNFNQDI
jgi:hypothetical protein